VNDKEKAERLAGLIEERRGYENRGLKDRVAAVDAEIAKITGQAAPPAARAAKRPAPKTTRAKKVEER